MCSFVKRCSNGLDWDDKLDAHVLRCVSNIDKVVKCYDPVQGQWSVPLVKKCKVWCDASSLAVGVVIEAENVRLED